jgi:hypothetical protein
MCKIDGSRSDECDFQNILRSQIKEASSLYNKASPVSHRCVISKLKTGPFKIQFIPDLHPTVFANLMIWLNDASENFKSVAEMPHPSGCIAMMYPSPSGGCEYRVHLPGDDYDIEYDLAGGKDKNVDAMALPVFSRDEKEKEKTVASFRFVSCPDMHNKIRASALRYTVT